MFARIMVGLAAVLLAGCSAAEELNEAFANARLTNPGAEAQEITWWELLSDVEQVYWSAEIEKYDADPAYEPVTDPPVAGVNAELEERFVRIPGFVVGVDLAPDNFTDASTFLFVPYPGACIHVPPPPVNQTIYADAGEYVSTNPFIPYWLVGRIRIQPGENDLAEFAYVVEDATLIEYEIEPPADPG